MTLHLFWCSTKSGDSDYWMVAEGAEEAELEFAVLSGASPDEVRTERIRALTSKEVLYVLNPESPCYPSKEQLKQWGVEYNSSFHIFHMGSRIFRPEGITRALMISNAKVALMKRLQGRKQKTVG